MSVESEIEALRDDVRSMRATLDSFFKTFSGDVMSRLATFEQWKITASSAQTKLEGQVEELQAVAIENRDLKTKATETKVIVDGLKTRNDELTGSIGTLKLFGGLAGAALAIAETAHFIWSMAHSVGH